MGGDLNAKHFAWGCRSFNQNGRKILRVIKNTTGADVWGPLHPTSRPVNGTGDIIDFFWGRNIQPPYNVETSYELDSDHFPVLAKWGLKTNQNQIRQQVDWNHFQTLCETQQQQELLLTADNLPEKSRIMDNQRYGPTQTKHTHAQSNTWQPTGPVQCRTTTHRSKEPNRKNLEPNKN